MKVKHFFTELFLLGSVLTNTSFAQESQELKVYNNYDFIPGEQVIFEDNFADAVVGEFPSRWKLLNQQGAINTSDGDKYFVFNDATVGSIGKIEPRIKTSSYLSDTYTVEFDFLIPLEEVMGLCFRETDDEGKFISIETEGTVKTNYFENQLSGNVPAGTELAGKWFHFAMAYKNKQMKCYINQSRVLVIPDCGFTPIALFVSGSQGVRLKNFKLGLGGGMNMLDKILTDGKFISHAIRFDINKSNIRGESMGFLNELAKWLKNNAAVKIQINGHTDSDGDDAANMKLSQARAEAVKNILISLGIDASRLKATGFGETKPVNSNDTPESKADNRRVEFVKIE